jgi:hypothetical protein
MGPPNYAMEKTYKLELHREPPEFNLSKGCWGFLIPPRGGDVRKGGSYQSGSCMGAVSGGAACGRARFDAVYEETIQPLDSVQVELC